MEVSVIVPVYNGERFIKNIINDLVRQEFKNFEVIFVNDGSTDNSVRVLTEELQSAELQFTLINENNMGPSSARNAGINVANGKFICFVDVDDNLNEKYLQLQYNELNNKQADICFCRMGGKHFEKESGRTEVIEKTKALGMFLRKEFIANACNAMFRKELLVKNCLLFDAKCRYTEDLHFNWRAIAYSEKIVLLDKKLYYYNANEGSLMSKFNSERYDNIPSFMELEEFFQKNCSVFYDTFKKFGVAKNIWSLTWQSAIKQDKKLYFENIKEYNVKAYMKRLKKFPKVTVRLSSKVFLFSPEIFRILAKIFGKRYTH
jgi:glycosyltransferase involved in cell wall biosynthesis